METNSLKSSQLKGFIEALKKSSFSQFLKKVHSKCNIFEYSKDNNKKTIMCTIDQTTLKATILQTATMLIALHGTTTNLDIKNLVHHAKPGCDLKQTEVSAIMNELYDEGKFNRENSTSGGDYWVYSAVLVADDVTGNITDVDDVTTPALLPLTTTPPATQPNNLTAVKTTAKKVTVVVPQTQTAKLATLGKGLNIQAIAQDGKGKGAVKIGLVGTQSELFLQKLSPDLRVAFDAKDAGNFEKYVLTDTDDMFEARNMLKFALGVKHNDCRSIKLSAYLVRAGVVPSK